MTTALDAAIEERPETRLTLHIEHDENGQVDASVLVRWCVSQDFLDDLKQRGFTRPFIVLVARSIIERTRDGDTYLDYRQDNVYVEELVKEARYVRFLRSGQHDIRVVVVNASSKRSRQFLRDLEKNPRTIFRPVYEVRETPESEESDEIYDLEEYVEGDWQPPTSVVEVEEDELKIVDWDVDVGSIGWLNFAKLSTFENISVPAEMFAQEYPDRIKKIVRRFYPKKDKDECDFKKRALKCIFIRVPLILTFGQLLKLICAAIAAFFGLTSPYWEDMLKPIQGSVWGPLRDLDSIGISVWFLNRKNKFRGPNPIVVINPPVVFLPAALAFGLMQLWALSGNHGHSTRTYPGWWDTLWMANLAMVSLFVAVVLLAFILPPIITLLGNNNTAARLSAWFGLRRTWLEGLSDRRLKKLDVLVCDNKPEEVDNFEAVAHPSIRLRFNHLKNKHCKPFAQ